MCIETRLYDTVLVAIWEAQQRGEPIKVADGPYMDSRFNSSVGKPAHKSLTCTVLKHLVHSGIVAGDVVGEARASVGHEVRSYPLRQYVVTFAC